MNLAKSQDLKSMHRYLAFLYTSNEKTERKIKETTTFTIAMKRIEYLGINVPKQKGKTNTRSIYRKP